MAKILIVEDNEMNRDVLSRRLVRRGYEIVMAVDGEEGIAAAKAESPDLILMRYEPAGRGRLGGDAPAESGAADPGDSSHRSHGPCDGGGPRKGHWRRLPRL